MQLRGYDILCFYYQSTHSLFILITYKCKSSQIAHIQRSIHRKSKLDYGCKICCSVFIRHTYFTWRPYISRFVSMDICLFLPYSHISDDILIQKTSTENLFQHLFFPYKPSIRYRCIFDDYFIPIKIKCAYHLLMYEYISCRNLQAVC